MLGQKNTMLHTKKITDYSIPDLLRWVSGQTTKAVSSLQQGCKQQRYAESKDLEFCIVSNTFCTVVDKSSGVGSFWQKTQGLTRWGVRRASTRGKRALSIFVLRAVKERLTAKGLP